MQLAKRTEPFQESVIREMTRLGDESGSINLSQGLPDFDSPPEVLEAAVEAVRAGDNQYTFPFGTLEFRQAVAQKSARYNRIQAEPEDEVTITCGVSEGVMSAVLALTDPGDEAIILEPWYENYLPDCRMAGVTPMFVPLHPPDYSLEPGELRRAITPRTRLLLLNTPHNPTGKVFSRGELEAVARVCSEHGIIAVTDEIYEQILYDGQEHVSLGSLPGMEDRTVTLSGLGKTYALTGWRVGWAVAAAEITRRIRKVHDYLTICAPSPFQAAGIAALNLPESYYSQMRAEYDRRRKALLPALEAAGFRFRQPEGAYYVMADFSSVEWDAGGYAKPEWTLDRAFAEFMARTVGVAVVPGSSFYAGQGEGTNLVRFNFARLVETLEEASRRIAAAFCSR